MIPPLVGSFLDSSIELQYSISVTLSGNNANL